MKIDKKWTGLNAMSVLHYVGVLIDFASKNEYATVGQFLDKKKSNVERFNSSIEGSRIVSYISMFEPSTRLIVVSSVIVESLSWHFDTLTI